VTNQPTNCKVTTVPTGIPRTKARACNIGLANAHGEYLVIYDAEDRPDRDQLWRAITAFQQSDDRVACIQSRLSFYNPRQNLLTSWEKTKHGLG